MTFTAYSRWKASPLLECRLRDSTAIGIQRNVALCQYGLAVGGLTFSEGRTRFRFALVVVDGDLGALARKLHGARRANPPSHEPISMGLLGHACFNGPSRLALRPISYNLLTRIVASFRFNTSGFNFVPKPGPFGALI